MATVLVIALTPASAAQASPRSSASSRAVRRAASALLAEGVAVSGVRLQGRGDLAGKPGIALDSAIELDREGNLPALWVGLQVHSGARAYRLQVDAFRLASSVMPGGRTVRAAASGAFVAADLLRPLLSDALQLDRPAALEVELPGAFVAAQHRYWIAAPTPFALLAQPALHQRRLMLLTDPLLTASPDPLLTASPDPLLLFRRAAGDDEHHRHGI